MPDPIYTVRLKTDLPAAITGNRFTTAETKMGWSGQPVEPYGAVIPGYGTEYPFSVEHVAVRLAVPGAAAFTVVALDEPVAPIDWSRVPGKPSYIGLQGCVTSVDTACGY